MAIGIFSFLKVSEMSEKKARDFSFLLAEKKKQQQKEQEEQDQEQQAEGGDEVRPMTFFEE
jgi:hypothetical protein